MNRLTKRELRIVLVAFREELKDKLAGVRRTVPLAGRGRFDRARRELLGFFPQGPRDPKAEWEIENKRLLVDLLGDEGQGKGKRTRKEVA